MPPAIIIASAGRIFIAPTAASFSKRADDATGGNANSRFSPMVWLLAGTFTIQLATKRGDGRPPLLAVPVSRRVADLMMYQAVDEPAHDCELGSTAVAP